MVKVIGWFQGVVGVGMVGLWVVLLAAGEVPEIPAGQRAIWFHIGAEVITGALLIIAGWTLLRRGDARSRLLSAFALGALLYTVVNSPGYYADRGAWALVVVFIVLALCAAAAFVRLLRPASAAASSAPVARREPV